MPVAALDEQVALVVVDLQQGTARNPFFSPVAEVIDKTARLAAAFRERGLPVVLAVMDLAAATPGRSDMGGRPPALPADFTELVPGLAPGPDDIRVTRTTWSCFAGTPLDARLRQAGVTQVVLAGVATSFGVESTARQAYDLGYNVVFATDAMTDISTDAHVGSVTRVFPVLGQTASTADLLDCIRVG